MNTWGERFRISIFGESHGEAIGVVVDGIPSGTPLDLEEIAREMKRACAGTEFNFYTALRGGRGQDSLRLLERKNDRNAPGGYDL